MALHLVQFLLPADQLPRLDQILEDTNAIDRWVIDGAEEQRVLVQLLVQRGDVEGVLDRIQDAFRHQRRFRLISATVDLTLPEVEEKEESETEEQPHKTYGWQRLSRQELLSKISSATKLERSYLAMVVLAVIVTASGLLMDNVAVIIAGMVIAPLLGPNIALALATTTGDGELLRRGLQVNVVGVGLALTMAIVLSFFVPDAMLQQPEIAGRTEPRWGDLPLALAAGTAGALSFTSGVSGMLVGVMVAVALLPPLIVLGLMLGHGNWGHAAGAAALLATNVICVNLAGVVTFLMQGVRPARWWEAQRARRTTRIALVVWLLLLVPVLVVLVLYGLGQA